MTDNELEKIYSETYRAVYWTAFSLLKNEEDAQDIVQDTFISLINSYDTIKDKNKILPWLKKVAANKSLNRLTRTKTDNVEDEFFDTVETVPEDFLPESIVESADMRRVIMDIINNALSEDIRRTLILFYFDEMSTKEISEALGIPEGTVSWRINSAKKKIKKEVEKYEEENDTKLFMVVPFLTQLFTKEAEQVAFKPISASLLGLSASTKAAEAAGSKLAEKAIKKGTEVMLKKIIIASVSVVLVGAATAGIIHLATRKDEKSDSKKRTGKNAKNEITEIDADEESMSEGQKKGGSGSGSGSDSGFGSADRPYVNYEDLKLKICGTVITMGKSTVSELVDTGSYVFFHPLKRYTAATYRPEENVEAGKLIIVNVYDLDNGETFPTGKNEDSPICFLAKAEKDGPATDAVICGFYFRVGYAEHWENEIEFEFPYTLTPEELVKNSGEASLVEVEEENNVIWYRYENGDYSMVFRFSEGTLSSITGEYDEGAKINYAYGIVDIDD